jgi:hypothetical protein
LAGSTSTTPEIFSTGDGRKPLGIQLCASQLTRRRPPSVSVDSVSEAFPDPIATSPSTESPWSPIAMAPGKRTGAAVSRLPSAGRRKRMCKVFRCAPSGAATASQPARAASGQRPSRVVQRRWPVARSTATTLPSEAAKYPSDPDASATPPGIDGCASGSARAAGGAAAASANAQIQGSMRPTV